MPLTNKKDFKDDNVLIPYVSDLVKEKIQHSNYEDNVDQAKQMGVHLKGDHPTKLLESYRPNEPSEIQQYRLSIYEPITKSQGKRICNVLAKIQQSSNYSIVFPEQKRVRDGEDLKSYTMDNYLNVKSK